MRRLIAILAAILVALLGLSFAMLNAQEVALNYYFGRSTMPLSLWMVVALFLGAVLGVASALGVVARQRRQLRRLRRNAETANRELEELRKLPIRNAP